MPKPALKHLDHWQDAGLIDAATAARIRAWEAAQPSGAPRRLGALAFGLGGLSLGAAVLLFVAAHWDALGPSSRFGLVLAMVAGLHVGASGARARLPALATTLHAVGTAALGAGVYLAGQIFNLGGDWPAALLLWALGAAAGFVLLRDWPQLLWTAVLVPLWLAARWLALFAEGTPERAMLAVLGVGATLVALAYLAAPGPERTAPWRVALSYLGAVALLPGVNLLVLGGAAARAGAPLMSLAPPFAAGWAVAVGLPLAVAAALRGARGLLLAAAVPWALALAATHTAAATEAPGAAPAARYLIEALGAVALVGFGVRERRALVVNLGILAFALTVVGFYFSNVFDRLGRAAGLAGLGLTFIAGGWALVRVRRDLLARIGSQAP